MRIGISGTTFIGKSTFMSDFLEIWSSYKAPTKKYSSVIKEKVDLKIGQTTEKIQEKILKYMLKEHKKYLRRDKVIFDSCLLDNLVYTLWAHDKGIINEKYVRKSIDRIRESMKYLDIIFLVPMSKVSTVDAMVTEDEYVFMTELDHIYKGVFYQWANNKNCTLFPRDDKPALIEIFGSQEERIALARMYLNDDGDPIDATPTLEQLGDIDDMQKLIDDQRELQKRKM